MMLMCPNHTFAQLVLLNSREFALFQIRIMDYLLLYVLDAMLRVFALSIQIVSFGDNTFEQTSRFGL